MKKCGYCGRENADQSDRCSECGTTLPEPAVEKPKSEPENHTFLEWLGKSIFYAGTFIVVALLYLLSFGPVDHYFIKVVTKTSTSNITMTSPTNAFSVVKTVTIRYPVWVSLLYRPAIYLRLRSELYARYVALWNRGQDTI